MKRIVEADIEVLYGKERKGDIKNSYFNIFKANKILGWTPKYTLEEGISKTLNYYFNVISNNNMEKVSVYRKRDLTLNLQIFDII